MIDGLYAAYSGVAAFGKKAEASSHNIAKYETKAPEAIPVPVESSAGSEPSNTDLGEEMVELGLARRLLEANAGSLKAQDETVGTLLDIMA
jgi:flagellar basal body rod protein FlgG